MIKNDKANGLFEIKLPPSREAKTLNNLDSVLQDKEELLFELNRDNHNFTCEQAQYLKSLLSLDITLKMKN